MTYRVLNVNKDNFHCHVSSTVKRFYLGVGLLSEKNYFKKINEHLRFCKSNDNTYNQ